MLINGSSFGLRVRLKTVFQTSEKIEFVQQSLGETVAKVFAIATSSSKLGGLSAATSPQVSVATNPRSQPELRAI
jgi:hypothetical protein